MGRGEKERACSPPLIATHDVDEEEQKNTYLLSHEGSYAWRPRFVHYAALHAGAAEEAPAFSVL